MERESIAVADELTAKTIGRATWRETLILTRNAGIRIGQQSLAIGKKMIVEHPYISTVAATGVFCSFYPDKARGNH